MAEDFKVTNKKTLIEFLKHCRDVHQAFVDNPSWCNKWSGNVDHHEKYVREYQEAINVVIKLRVK